MILEYADLQVITRENRNLPSRIKHLTPSDGMYVLVFNQSDQDLLTPFFIIFRD